jgi:hypothetical protein
VLTLRTHGAHSRQAQVAQLHKRSPSPGVGGRGDGGRSVAAHGTGDARVGLGLAVVVGGEAGGESTRPVGGAGGVDVDGDVELLEGADVLENKKRVRYAWLLVCCSVCTHSNTD